MKHIQESIIGRRGSGTLPRIIQIKDKLHWEFFEPDTYNINYNYESRDWYMFQDNDIVLFWDKDAVYYPYFFKADLEIDNYGNKYVPLSPNKKWKLLSGSYDTNSDPKKAYDKLIKDFDNYSRIFMNNITYLNYIYVPEEVKDLIKKL